MGNSKQAFLIHGMLRKYLLRRCFWPTWFVFWLTASNLAAAPPWEAPAFAADPAAASKAAKARPVADAESHARWAENLLAMGLVEAARGEAQKAIEIEPKSAAHHRLLAKVLAHDLLGR